MEQLEKADEFPELSDTDWLCDLVFAVDILSHINELNVKLLDEFYASLSAAKFPNIQKITEDAGVVLLYIYV